MNALLHFAVAVKVVSSDSCVFSVQWKAWPHDHMVSSMSRIFYLRIDPRELLVLPLGSIAYDTKARWCCSLHQLWLQSTPVRLGWAKTKILVHFATHAQGPFEHVGVSGKRWKKGLPDNTGQPTSSGEWHRRFQIVQGLLLNRAWSGRRVLFKTP